MPFFLPPITFVRLPNAAAVDPAIHEDKVTGINAALGLILDAARQLSAVSTDQNINCDSFFTDFNEAESHGILGAVDSAAQNIIITADKELAAINDIIAFIEDWSTSQPPTITDFSLIDDPPPSPKFRVSVTAEDREKNLDKLKITIIPLSVSNLPIEREYDFKDPTDFISRSCVEQSPGSLESCTVVY